jgi:hypothetical protein
MKEIEFMSSIMPFLRIEQESPSQLHLASADRRWVIMIFSLLFISPFICFGVLIMAEEDIRLFGAAFILIGAFIFWGICWMIQCLAMFEILPRTASWFFG